MPLAPPWISSTWPGGQVGGHHQVRPHRAGHFRQARGIVQVDTVGDRHDLAGGHSDVFGVAAARQQSADLLPGRPCRDVVAHRRRRRRRPPCRGSRWHPAAADSAGGLQQVGPVDAGRADLDQHFAAARRDVGDLLPDELIGGFSDDRIHGRHATTCGFRAVPKAMCRIA